MKNWVKSSRIQLILILTLGLILRLIFCFGLSLPHQHTDSYMYLDQANALIAGKYINYAPNGYPFLLAACIKLLGYNLLIVTSLCINVILGTWTIWLVYHIAFQTFRNTFIAIIAATLMALYPNQLNYTRWILTEIPCTFLLVLSIYLYFKNQKFFSGLSLGVSVLFRTPLLPIGLLLLGIELVVNRKIAYSLIGGLVLPLLFIGSYCYLKTGKFSITGNETVNVIYAVSSYTDSTNGEIDWGAAERHPEIKTSSRAWKLYFDHAKHHPLKFIKQRLSSFWELWGFYPSSLGGSRGIGSRIIIGISNLFLIICAGWAFWKNRAYSKVYVIIAPFLSLTAIYVLLVSLARYTVPMEPFLIILTSWTVGHLGSRMHNTHYKYN